MKPPWIYPGAVVTIKWSDGAVNTDIVTKVTQRDVALAGGDRFRLKAYSPGRDVITTEWADMVSVKDPRSERWMNIRALGSAENRLIGAMRDVAETLEHRTDNNPTEPYINLRNIIDEIMQLREKGAHRGEL